MMGPMSPPGRAPQSETGTRHRGSTGPREAGHRMGTKEPESEHGQHETKPA
jgi:hypothetical protein